MAPFLLPVRSTPLEKRPTWDWVKGKLEERRSLYSSLHTAWEEDQGYHLWTSGARLALQPYVAGIPEGFELVLLPWGEMAVQTGANRIVAGEEPDVAIVFPDGAFDSYPKEERERVERERRDLYIRWVRACMRRILGRSALNAARDQAIKTLSLGAGPLMWPLDYHRWPDPPHGGWLPVDDDGVRKPKPLPDDASAAQRADRARWERQRRDNFPWAVSSPSPFWLFWDPNNNPPRDYIIEEEVPASDADEYGDTPEAERRGDDQKRMRVTYVSGDWIGQWIDNGIPLLKGKGAVGGVVKNLSVRPFVTVAFSGMGSTDRKANWEQKVKGMIRDGRGIILALAKAVNFVAAMGETYAFPGMILRGPGARQAAEDLQMGAGAKTVVDDMDTQIDPMKTPSSPQEAYRLYEMATSAFAAFFGSDVLRGEAQPGEPARSHSARATLAGMPFEAPKVALEQAWSLMAVDMTEQVKFVLREPVYVDGVTMRPRDVIEGTQVHIDLTPLTEDDKDRRKQADMALIEMGLMSKVDFIRKHLGIDDADRVLNEIDTRKVYETLLVDPDVAGPVKQTLLADLQEEFGVPSPPPEAPPEGMIAGVEDLAGAMEPPVEGQPMGMPPMQDMGDAPPIEMVGV